MWTTMAASTTTAVALQDHSRVKENEQQWKVKSPQRLRLQAKFGKVVLDICVSLQTAIRDC